MARYNHTALDDVVDQMARAKKRDEAFYEALRQLFIANPIPEWMHEMHHAVRGSALRKARGGGYCDYAPGGMVRWRKQLEENATDWGVPPDQVVAIHALIYG
jgi:hypothetical protein